MTITSIQKVIKVGSSLAVTIPAKEAAAAGIVAGSEVEFQATPYTMTEAQAGVSQLTTEYEAFKKQYAQTLKNLSQR